MRDVEERIRELLAPGEELRRRYTPARWDVGIVRPDDPGQEPGNAAHGESEGDALNLLCSQLEAREKYGELDILLLLRPGEVFRSGYQTNDDRTAVEHFAGAYAYDAAGTAYIPQLVVDSCATPGDAMRSLRVKLEQRAAEAME